MEEASVEAFRLEVRQWLAANLDREVHGVAPWTSEGLAARRDWERMIADAGYSVLGWPARWGGRDASLAVETAFAEEYLAAGAPDRLNKVGLGMAGPTILERGTEAQQSRWLPGIADGSEIWCQGFSEPGAGSDLASLVTRGRWEDGEIVINGQKTWTTDALIADWMFALVRTSTESDRRQGLTFVMVPMGTPGVEVRPIRQLHGAPGFADVFLDEVRVPVDHILGDVGEGWTIARVTLRHERSSGLASHVSLTRSAADLARRVRQMRLERSSRFRVAVAEAFVSSRSFASYVAGCRANPELDRSSETKLVWSEARSRILESMVECVAESGSDDLESVETAYWHNRAAEIFGGANEVQRNMIARRALGLPRQEAVR